MVKALTSAQPQIQGVAGTSLGQGFQAVYLAAGIAATLSAILTLFISARSSAPAPEAIAETTEANAEAAVQA
jgi:L-lactate permease